MVSRIPTALENLAVDFPKGKELDEQGAYDLLRSIVDATRYQIRVDPRGLIMGPGGNNDRYTGALRFTAVDEVKCESASFLFSLQSRELSPRKFGGMIVDYSPDVTVDRWGSEPVAARVNQAVRQYFAVPRDTKSALNGNFMQ